MSFQIVVSAWPKAVSLLLLMVCTSAAGFSRIEKWSEEPTLSDGRAIRVQREAGFTFQFVSGDSGSMRLFSSEPDTFSIRFKHPDTKRTVMWQGKQHYYPVLFDIVEGVPYLVVMGRSSKKTESQYGCPELPYAYLKYEFKFSGVWSPIPLHQIPNILRTANLSPYYPSFNASTQREMTAAQVLQQMLDAERNSRGFFQRLIPKSYQEWNYLYKNEYLNERKPEDCRPPRVPLPQIALPVAVEETPEILETIYYDPVRIAIGDDWSSLVFDQKRNSECKNLFRATDPSDYFQGQRFVRDTSGKNPVPYTRNAQFEMGVKVLCDDHVWFVTHLEEPGKNVITKFTVTGDLVYRTSFRNPDQVEGYIGRIRIPSLRTEGGYLYFDWLDFRDIKREWSIKRWLKMRMKEPPQVRL